MDISTFFSSVDTIGDCWLWTGRINWKGYGNIKLDGRTTMTHRVMYELAVAPIASGLQIDHLCRTRNCMKPEHLEAVSCKENIQRGETGWHNKLKTHCSKGHEFTAETTGRDAAGFRLCRTCRNEKDRARRARAKLNP